MQYAAHVSPMGKVHARRPFPFITVSWLGVLTCADGFPAPRTAAAVSTHGLVEKGHDKLWGAV